MEKSLQFHIEDFEGPLDLLLALVAKNKMSIYDIEILVLIDQYLEIVGRPDSPEVMDSASEFISMAARLVQIKSTLLLPRSEEAERMREELTGLLVEYSACKRIAGQLGEMARGIFLAVRAPAQIELDTTYRGRHEAGELAAAYTAMMGRSAARRAPRQEHFEELVAAPFVSVGSRIVHVLRGLVTGKVHTLSQVFNRRASRSETVATFLAVLELVRGGRIEIDNEETIRVTKRKAKARRGEGGAGNGA